MRALCEVNRRYSVAGSDMMRVLYRIMGRVQGAFEGVVGATGDRSLVLGVESGPTFSAAEY